MPRPNPHPIPRQFTHPNNKAPFLHNVHTLPRFHFVYPQPLFTNPHRTCHTPAPYPLPSPTKIPNIKNHTLNFRNASAPAQTHPIRSKLDSATKISSRGLFQRLETCIPQSAPLTTHLHPRDSHYAILCHPCGLINTPPKDKQKQVPGIKRVLNSASIMSQNNLFPHFMSTLFLSATIDK